MKKYQVADQYSCVDLSVCLIKCELQQMKKEQLRRKHVDESRTGSRGKKDKRGLHASAVVSEGEAHLSNHAVFQVKGTWAAQNVCFFATALHHSL